MTFLYNIKRISIIGFSLMMLFSCKNDIKKVMEISQIENVPDLSGENLYFTQSEYGNINLEVFTKSFSKFSRKEDAKIVFNDGIKVVHFTTYPDTLSILSANYAVLYEDKEYWEASGNVYARNTKGEVLNTEYLVWDQQKQEIYTDKMVQITTPDDVIMGKGFHSDQYFNTWQIDEVTGIITFEEE